MIHIFITVKPSERYPGKNAALWHYTEDWLVREMKASKEPVRVYTVGDASELPPDHPDWRHIDTPCKSHRDDLALAEKKVKPKKDDVLVLLQLTNPVRSEGLLRKAATGARTIGTCVSARLASLSDWRVIRPGGTWRYKPTTDRDYLLDGAIYAWRPGKLDDIFNPLADHAVAGNGDGPIVDIDYPTDFHPVL